MSTFTEEVILHLTPEQEQDSSNFVDPNSGVDLEVIDKMPLVEWFANNYKNFGTTLEFVTNRWEQPGGFCVEVMTKEYGR